MTMNSLLLHLIGVNFQYILLYYLAYLGDEMRFILFVLLLLEFISSAQEYQMGEGYNIPKTPIYIGGYGTLDYVSRVDGYNRFRVDELALLSYGMYDRFSYMASVDMKESYVKEWGTDNSVVTDDRVSLERLYLDYNINDTLRLRVGKFNTPAGYWNMEPINILRETSSVPYTSYILFPRYSTGAEIKYSNRLYSDTEYSLQVQENQDLDDYYNNISVNRHYLLGAEHFFNDDFKMKGNLGYFTSLANKAYYYALLALSYESQDYKIMSEFGSRKSSDRFTVPYSFYLQGAWHLSDEHDLVGRVETYKIDEGANREEFIEVLGYTYRPTIPFTFKVEYRHHSYINENQIRTSISVMF